MGLSIINPASANQTCEAILGYGSPGSGKTRLFTSLTERFGKIAYVALDERSEGLQAVLPQYQPRITVVKPDWKNPVVDGAEIVFGGWKKKGFDTLILDTFSALTWKWLSHITNTGSFQANHVKIGDVAMPDKGDYGGVYIYGQDFITKLMEKNPDVHLIVICHEDLDKDEKSGSVAGGPSTAGRALAKWLPGRFATVMRLDRLSTNIVENGTVMQKSKYVVRMAPHGAWVARRNENSLKGNPLPSFELGVDPLAFWQKYDETSPLKGVA